MKVVIASDHAGFDLKNLLADEIRKQGHEVHDVGAFNKEPSDYPDFAEALGQEILNGKAERGVLICGSGVGASVAANKIPGIRAGLAHDEYSAHQGVEHDEMNVLVLGARVIGPAIAAELVERFLASKYSGEPRHARRLAKVKAIEARYSRG
jgi:ribose 5-phosphate isomerase B